MREIATAADGSDGHSQDMPGCLLPALTAEAALMLASFDSQDAALAALQPVIRGAQGADLAAAGPLVADVSSAAECACVQLMLLWSAVHLPSSRWLPSHAGLQACLHLYRSLSSRMLGMLFTV